MDVVGQIMAYEDGELDDAETLELFSELVKSGMAWSLQGSYGRAAAALIEAGYLSPTGEILVSL
jgi:hypothetical protein